MANDKNYWTSQREDGQWAVQKEGGERASSLHKTQAEAWEAAKQNARQTGGEAFLKGRDGKIRERNTYGTDPHPPRG